MPLANPRISYVLPLRSAVAQTDAELTSYLAQISEQAEVIVVDGSSDDVYRQHHEAWGMLVQHVAPDLALATPMGKVGNVLTGLRLASHERVVIADDDVRYNAMTLRRVADALDDGEVVRPQNYFVPLPWHACWDTGRILLNRMTGGDWPGTLAVRRSVLTRTGGYDGSALFENLELVRTVVASGGREVVLLDAFVARRPSTARHFWSQRVRQAYDELARPLRLGVELALAPGLVMVAATGGLGALAVTTSAVVLLAEAGRRRAGGRKVFPMRASLLAPVWLAERAITSWVALGARLILGGVPYRGTILRHAATPMRVLRRRHGAAPLSPALPEPVTGSRRQSA